MRKESSEKKLVLNKETITILSEDALSNIHGAAVAPEKTEHGYGGCTVFTCL